MINTKSKPTLAYVDHSFHKISKSTVFLRDILSSQFEITEYWDDSWNGGNPVSIDELNKHDYVVFFQTINPISELQKIHGKIIWVPMYDSENFNYLYWKIISVLPIKIISFSKKIYNHCKNNNIDVLYLKYFIEPKDIESSSLKQGNHFFFWYRGGINFDNIKKIIKPQDVNSFTYKSTPDPKKAKEVISEKDKQDYKMNIIESDFIPKKEYNDLLSKCNIFIAPRKKEGVGLSFLEAIATGKCVISYDDATMNEYITHNKTGYLFNNGDSFIKLNELSDIIKNSKELAVSGYAEWQNSIKNINPFVYSLTPPKNYISSRCIFYIYYPIYIMLHKIFITMINFKNN